jgi:MYXO-CTERM domain-containing protein
VRTAVLTAALSLATLALTASPAAATNPACSPPTVMVVLDKSSSMTTGTINGVSKWNIAVNALGQVLTELQHDAAVGLMTFPRPDRCGPGGVDVAPALDSRAAILGALGTPPPSSGYFTPMAQTLERAAIEPTLVDVATPRYVVVITDGWQWCSPYDPATRFDGVTAVESLNAVDVTTYVVGFGGATDALALNRMAVTANTALPGCDPTNDLPSDPNQCYYQADNAAMLIAALQQIAAQVAVETCDGVDNDCDGLIDEDVTRACASACGTGTETCNAGAWVGCDAPAAGPETCNGVDDDCDGNLDPGCDCVAGTTRACGETSTVGACHPGVQTCGADGRWGDCVGSVGPSPEQCNNIDEDCSGAADDTTNVLGCAPDHTCSHGTCVPTDPVTPPNDEDDPNSGFDEGVPAGCGCASGAGGAGGAMGGLLLAMAVALGVRRRRRA